MNASKILETEILVVGGGPAGVISAITAAKAGREVILIDSKPHEEIGNKVCGDALAIEPIKFLREKLGIEFPHGNEVRDTVKKLVIEARDIGFPIEGDPLGFIVHRHNYGQRLLSNVEKVGVIVKDRVRVIRALTDNTSVTGVKFKDLRDNSVGELKSKITIDCSGYRCIVRKTLPHDKFPLLENRILNEDVMVSYREIIHLKDRIRDHDYLNTIVMIYKDDIPMPGYFWVFSEGSYRLNVGICYFRNMKTKESPRNLYQRILKRDYYRSDQFEVVHGKGFQIPSRFPLLNAVAGGFLTAGDAAHHVDPRSCEGHGPALIAGYYAGKTAVEAIEANNTTQEHLWSYNTAVMDHFGFQQCKAQILTKVLRQIGMSGLEFLFRRNILSTGALLELNEGNRPSRKAIIGIIMRLFPKYNILFKLNRVVRTTSRLNEVIRDYPVQSDDFLSWKSKILKILRL